MEREARSLALEEAYVHEVYHQMGCQESKAPWPRVVQFLNHLEPGSIVCDVGCGSGKYLSVNPSVFKLGVDRCNRLAETAKLEQNEVLVCDNLTLPFRDESFDAVLSIAVVHHFATTERRVGALRELARVLKIGGRLVISVWAMEQRHRKDVLVPWHRPQALSTPSLELTPTTTSEDDSHLHHPYTACTQTSDSDSNRSVKNSKDRVKGKEKQKEATTSPSCSSLSSPNETCYSFVRRALQKLAGNKRSGSRNRPWFLDSWTSCSSKDPPPRRYDPEGCEDIHDLPIELRRLEEDQDISSRRQAFKCSGYSNEQQLNQKSRSLTDIFNHEQKCIVRSQSSVPSLDNVDLEVSTIKEEKEVTIATKPRLVKQKKSVCDEDIDEERDQATDMKNLVKALPEFKVTGIGSNRKGNVFKQSSMNEELMSTERLREKEKLKQNIQKQASLNEELIFNRNNRTLDSLKDSIFSTSTAKRFQILKNGLTNKIKNSTTGIEKVAGASIKNGFVRILQGWASSDVNIQIPQQISNPATCNLPEIKNLIIDGRKEQANERRHSKEDGSDSSKDSSLQSDTSVDSEDSFASVIFIPKAEQVDQQSTNTSPTLQSNPASPQPTSPKIKFPPPVSPKLKTSQHSFGITSHPVSPMLKHPNQLLGSSTPSSPKIKYFPQPTSPRPYQNSFSTSPTRTTFKPHVSPNGNSVSPTSKSNDIFSKPSSSVQSSKSPPNNISPPSEQSTTVEPCDNNLQESNTELKIMSTEDIPAKSLKKKNLTQSNFFSTKVDLESFKNVGNANKQLGQQSKDDHQKTVSRAQFPLVRRSMTISGRSDSPPSRPVPRLLSLEIFNPETDDMDSDSSGLSSPDSIGSVISIKNDEEASGVSAPEQKKTSLNDNEIRRTSGVGAEISSLILKTYSQNESSESEYKIEEINSSKLSPLLEAAAGVANCLEETVDTVIQSSPRSKRKQLQLMCDPWMALQDEINSHLSPKTESHESDCKSKGPSQLSSNCIPSPNKSKPNLKNVGYLKVEVDSKYYLIQEYNNSWDEECRQHLAEFAEKLSEKLLAEIDRYQEQNSKSQQLSPDLQGVAQSIETNSELYLSRLSEELQDINRMSIDLLKDDDNYILKLIDSENKILLNQDELGRIKGEGASSEEKHVESKKEITPPPLETSIESNLVDSGKIIPSIVELDSVKDGTVISTEGNILLLQKENECVYSSPIDLTLYNPEPKCKNKPHESDNIPSKDNQTRESREQSSCNEKLDELNVESEMDICSNEGAWMESRRNTILKNVLPQSSISENKEEKDCDDDYLKIDLVLNREYLRKPSISIELSDFPDKNIKDKEENSEYSQLSIGLSIESNEGGDTSERTASSSDGSRSGSRRETMQISDSGSVLSLRPGLSIESSDAGEISDKGGSDGSRDSRRDTICSSDVTSSSQNSLLRPGNSMESSDPGDTSEKTGSDLSRQTTSSAGKTPSTASFTSDRASDCSKDARFADRRMARCDGRSSSEETPLPKSCTNKLVRQGASTQEPSETMSKTRSSETTLSGSTSQDSLISDNGGGAITFHRYYHVFKEGELDQLIEKYVENLHIISSYYDHANWCIIAEKVQVWTI